MIRETYLTFIIKLISAVLGILITSTVTNSLNIEDTGDYFYLIAIVTFIIPIALSGFGHFLLKEFSSKKISVEKLIGFSISITLFNSVWTGLFLILLINYNLIFNNIDFQTYEFTYLLIIIIFYSIGELFAFIYQSIDKSWLGNFWLVCSKQLIILIGIYSFNIDQFNELLIILSIASIVSFIFSYFAIKNKVIISFDYSLKYIMYLKQTKNFLANHLMGTLNGSLLPLLIGVLSTSSQVAYFGVALKIVSITSFILVPINKVVAPKYAACFKKNDKGGLGNVAQFSSRVTWLFSVPIILLLLLGANHLLTFFGDDYLDNALIIFYIMLLGQLVNSLSGSVGWLLQMTNNEVLYRNLSTLNLFLMLTTAFIIIPEYGALGAAIVYSFSLIFINFTSAYYVKKKIGINIYRFW